MQKTKVTFTNSNGETLAGVVEQPDIPVRAYALFAHCFTCGMQVVAGSRISRALTEKGYGVLRFDFTGLGSSDGDFANSNFSSNVQDLVCAAEYMREHWLAPSLLVGHSLGGTAILRAAGDLSEVKALVTIGAPADASHVVQQFSCDVDAIKRDGKAEVNLAGRSFTIKKQFLEDIEQDASSTVGSRGKAILVMHSPVDQTVSIDQAEKIYRSVMHPKSFITLDNADHLLTNKFDAEYTANLIAAWAERYVDKPELLGQIEDSPVATGQIRVEEKDASFTQLVRSDQHQWLADEPLAAGGHNLGPDPYEHLLAALGTCTSMTLRMVAGRKKWPLDKVTVELEHSRQHGEDCEYCDEQNRQIDLIERRISLQGDLSDEQRDQLLSIADRCPVHRTLHGKVVVKSELI